MIKLERQPMDAGLAAAVAARDAQLQLLLDGDADVPDSLANSYRRPELKAHLMMETNSKCAYCESKITHVYFGDVEHILAKDAHPRLRLRPSNLTVACAVCNNRKRAYDDPTCPLLNPFDDNPAQELVALGWWVRARPARQRAKVTIEQLDLNRAELLERRRERVQMLEALAEVFASLPPGPAKELARAELIRQAECDKEYSMAVRAYLEQVVPDLQPERAA